ncbi:MAG: hypothetical protein GC183_14710 [Thiobacillus sp.]|nr:hypothetical protein [Thiobacillus sp.]
MAVGTLITVLSNIPWGQVVENAPKVADGAVKLWNSVTNRNKPDAIQGSQAAAEPPSEADRLKARLLALEDGVTSLQDQMQASSALIKDLAEQNTQLVQRIELNRVRLVRYSVATALQGAVLLAAVVYLLLRQ